MRMSHAHRCRLTCIVVRSGDVQLYNPVFDYIAPEMVSLFVTNNGCHSPSYVYRLITDYYALEDESLLQ